MNRSNLTTWIVLVALTVVGFALGGRGALPVAILAIAALKFALVAWQFMELRKAAAVWSVALAGFAGGVLLIALALV